MIELRAWRGDSEASLVPSTVVINEGLDVAARPEWWPELREEGIETTWQLAYNAGANPVPIRLRQEDLARPVVQDLLRATFEILDPGAIPWSERHPEATAQAGRAAAAPVLG